MSAPAATVVVPTRDRPDHLRACLAALAAQSAPAVEIVVVDDRSVDAAAIAAIVGSVTGARLVRGEGRGPAAARNLGADHARAPIVCFTDDDCRPARDWVRAVLDRFARDGAATAAVAGPTVTGEVDNRWSVASQVITNHLTDQSLEPDGRLGFAPTSNLAVRTAVHREHRFDERYPLAAGEDREWCARLAGGGHRLVFEATAGVHHHQDLSPRSFWRQQVRYGRGAYRFHRDRKPGERLAPARFYVDLVRAGLAHGRRVAALIAVAQVATAAGLVGEAVRARR